MKHNIELSFSKAINDKLNDITRKLSVALNKDVYRNQILSLAIIYLSELPPNVLNSIFTDNYELARIVKVKNQENNTMGSYKFSFDLKISDLLCFVLKAVDVDYILKKSGFIRVAIKIISEIDIKDLQSLHQRNIDLF